MNKPIHKPIRVKEVKRWYEPVMPKFTIADYGKPIDTPCFEKVLKVELHFEVENKLYKRIVAEKQLKRLKDTFWWVRLQLNHIYPY